MNLVLLLNYIIYPYYTYLNDHSYYPISLKAEFNG